MGKKFLTAYKTALVLFLFILAISCKIDSSHLKESGVIINDITDKHILIPGTHVYMIPPSSFVPANNFTGFKKLNDNSGIQVYDLTNGNFYKNAADFNRETLETKGTEVFEYQDFHINGFQAKYINMRGNPDLGSHCLTFGDSTFSVMIIGACPIHDKKSNDEIKQALYSVVYDENLVIDPLTSAPFSLDDNTSIFKFATTSANIYFYSVDGIAKDNYGNESIMTVSVLPKTGQLSPTLAIDLALNSLIQYGLSEAKTHRNETEKLRKIEIFEREVYGKIKGNQALIYYLATEKDDKILLINGISYSDFEKDLAEFKKAAHSARLK